MSANAPAHAYRVLGGNGEIRPGFKWNDPEDKRDVRELLAQEGVEFDMAGRANRAQRLKAPELRELVG